MKKTVVALLIVMMLISTSVFTFASQQDRNDNEETKFRLITATELKKLDQAVLKYQLKHNKQELTIEEVYKILDTLKIKNVKLQKIDDINILVTTMSRGLDVIYSAFSTTLDTNSWFQVTFTMKNLDIIDTHNYYRGTIDGFSETGLMSGVFLWSTSHAVYESQILPGKTRVHKGIILQNRGGRAYFQSTMYYNTNGVEMGPQIITHKNYKFY